jgi:hypothetical protein
VTPFCLIKLDSEKYKEHCKLTNSPRWLDLYPSSKSSGAGVKRVEYQESTRAYLERRNCKSKTMFVKNENGRNSNAIRFRFRPLIRSHYRYYFGIII